MNLKTEILSHIKKDSIIRNGFIGLLIIDTLIVFSELRANSNSKDDLRNRNDINIEMISPESADTYIPTGYVLIPLVLQNSESIGALMGSFAVVNLYRTQENDLQNSAKNQPEKIGQKIAENVKLLRAPLNPSQFAVLVPEADAPRIAGLSSSIVAVLQNKSNSNKIEMAKSHSKEKTIFYYQDSQNINDNSQGRFQKPNESGASTDEH